MRELTRIREHREWVESDANQRKGKRHFRDCHEGCPAMSLYKGMKELGRDNQIALDAACSACKLDVKPMREAHVVMELAMRPKSMLDFKSMSYWMVAGITTYRAMTRSVF